MPSLHSCLKLAAYMLSSIFISNIASAQSRLKDICTDCVIEHFASCGGFLEGATVDQHNVLWVVDLLSGNIMTVDDSGECTVQGNTGGQPNGAKFHKDGRLFIADKALGILAFNPSDKSITTIINSYRSELLRGVNDMVFDADGGLYFTEPYGSDTLNPNGRVFYLPPETGSMLKIVADNFAFPNGIALNLDGSRLYVGEYANKQIISMPSLSSQDIYDSAFVFTRFIGGIGPDGFALDDKGNVYAAIFQSGSIQISDSIGFPIATIKLPQDAGTFTTNLAFKDNYLYITESSQGNIWRMKVNTQGLSYFHQQ